MTAGGNNKGPVSSTDGKESVESSRARRKQVWVERVTDLARWRVAARNADYGAGGPQETNAEGARRSGGGKDRPKGKSGKEALEAKITALAQLREDAYYYRNVSGEGAKTRLVIDGDDREGYLLETFIRLAAGQSSTDLPPDYGELLACHADYKKRQWFDDLLRTVPDISIVVRVLRFVMKGRTLVLVSWGFGEKKDPVQVPRFFDTAGDHVEDCCGYWGELKDLRGRKLREVVYGWFPSTDQDRLVWFGDGKEAGKKKTENSPEEFFRGSAKNKPVKRERGKRKEVSIKAAAVLCRVSERTIKNWDAGKATPKGWPGRGDLRDLQTFAVKRGNLRVFKKALQKGLRSVLHPGDMETFADKSEED